MFDPTDLVCFRVYDLNGDRYISKEEMFQMLKNSLVKEAVEEDEDGVKDLVDLVLKKLDEDRDGRVSEADWSSAIAKEQLLMEAFGRCLPPKKVSFDSQRLRTSSWMCPLMICSPIRSKNKTKRMPISHVTLLCLSSNDMSTMGRNIFGTKGFLY
jgi:hypothetical protein